MQPLVPDVSAILINWNATELTANALASLRERTAGVTYEVFVADNGSSNRAAVAQLAAAFPWVRFLYNASNVGFTRANNQAVRMSTGRYVLLLNNDTIQTENAIGKAVGYMDGHPKVGALGILHRNNDAERSFQPSSHQFPSLGGLLRMLSPRAEKPRENVEEHDADWLCGSFLLIRRECLDRVGLLDEQFFAYSEDIDWCRRAWKAGWPSRFWPGASMIHLGSGSAPQLRDKTWMIYRSELTYFRKHFGRLGGATYFILMGAVLAASLLKQATRLVLRRGSRQDVRHRWSRLTDFVRLRPADTQAATVRTATHE